MSSENDKCIIIFLPSVRMPSFAVCDNDIDRAIRIKTIIFREKNKQITNGF